MHVASSPLVRPGGPQEPENIGLGTDGIQLEVRDDFSEVLLKLKRQWRKVVVCAAAGGAIAAIVVVAEIPRFQASTSVLVDNQRLRALDESYATNAPSSETGAVESQVEIIRGEKIGLVVVRKAGLTKDEEFVGTGSGLLGVLLAGLQLGNAPDGSISEEFKNERRALAGLQRAMDVRRVGKTYLVEIEVMSRNAQKAAMLANAVADTYLELQVNAQFEATRRAGEWLNERTNDLRQKWLSAELLVESFRKENGLVGAAGRLIGDQQLQELNSQLVAAKLETATAEARYERIASIVKNGNSDAAVTEALENPVVAGLRAKYFEASKREDEVARRLGKDHEGAVSLRSDMREYSRLILAELARIGESYRSDLLIAKSKQEAIAKTLAESVGANAEDNTTLVGLRKLEREAESYRAIYQSALQRYRELGEQQSFPTADARVVTAAAKSLVPRYPQKKLGVALGLIIGAAFGALLGAISEVRERSFRTGFQIRSSLGLQFLGALPLVSKGLTVRTELGSDDGKGPGERAILPTAELRKQPPRPGALHKDPLREVTKNPGSPFDGTLRSVKGALDLAMADRASKVIGVISTEREEGRSVVASNLALLLAAHGKKTLLMDADVNRPARAAGFAPDGNAGSYEFAWERERSEDGFRVEEKTGLYLFTFAQHSGIEMGEIVAAPEFKALLREQGKRFQYILVDLPPLGMDPVLRAGASMFDSFIMVVEWGRLRQAYVKAVLDDAPQIRRRCLGVILNKVDKNKEHLYGGGE